MDENHLIHNAHKLEVSYNKIDAFFRKELNQPPYVPFKELIKQYKAKNKWWNDSDFIELIATTRNILVHYKNDMGYIILPTDELVQNLLRAQRRLTNPLKVIPKFKKEITTVQIEENLSAVLELIDKKSFSQFPVYQGEKFIGLITENSITRWVARNHKAIGMNLPLDQVRVQDVVALEEMTTTSKFIPKNTSVVQVPWFFSNEQALEAVLISEKVGKKTNLLGIITRWDVIGLKS